MKFCENCKYLTWVMDGFTEQSKMLMDFINKNKIITKKKRQRLCEEIEKMYQAREHEWEDFINSKQGSEKKRPLQNRTCEVPKKTI